MIGLLPLLCLIHKPHSCHNTKQLQLHCKSTRLLWLIIPYITVSNQNGCQRLWGWQSIDVASKAAGSQSCRVLVWLGTEPWRVTDRLWPRPSLPPPYSPFLQQIPLVYLLHSLVNSNSQLMLDKKNPILQVTWIWCIEASQVLSVSSAMNLVLFCFFNSLPCALTVQGSEVCDRVIENDQSRFL